MQKNMGTVDRTIRVVFALLIAVLYFTGSISGTAGIILGIIAIVMLITGFVGVCPAYLPFKISTKKKTE